MEAEDAEIDEIAQRILLELESASSKDLSDARYAKMMLRLSDVHYAKRVLQQLGSATKHSSGVESDIERRAVIKVLLFSTWVQRLYFVIRSFLMGEIGGGITFIFIWYLHSVDAVTMFIIGIPVFALTLVLTRLFDTQLTKATRKIVELMANHRTARDFVMNHF